MTNNSNPLFSFDCPIVCAIKSEQKLETIEDGMTIDIDDDGEDEIIAITYLGGLYILKQFGVTRVSFMKNIYLANYTNFNYSHDCKHPSRMS